MKCFCCDNDLLRGHREGMSYCKKCGLVIQMQDKIAGFIRKEEHPFLYDSYKVMEDICNSKADLVIANAPLFSTMFDAGTVTYFYKGRNTMSGYANGLNAVHNDDYVIDKDEVIIAMDGYLTYGFQMLLKCLLNNIRYIKDLSNFSLKSITFNRYLWLLSLAYNLPSTPYNNDFCLTMPNLAFLAATHAQLTDEQALYTFCTSGIKEYLADSQASEYLYGDLMQALQNFVNTFDPSYIEEANAFDASLRELYINYKLPLRMANKTLINPLEPNGIDLSYKTQVKFNLGIQHWWELLAPISKQMNIKLTQYIPGLSGVGTAEEQVYNMYKQVCESVSSA